MQSPRPNRYSRQAAVESADPIVTPAPLVKKLSRFIKPAVAAAAGSALTVTALVSAGMVGAPKTRQQSAPAPTPSSSNSQPINDVTVRNLKAMSTKLQSTRFDVDGNSYELDYWMGTVGYAFSDGAANSVQVEGVLSNLDASGRKTMQPNKRGPALYVAPAKFLATQGTGDDMSLATVFNSCDVIEPGQSFTSTRNDGSIDCATVNKMAPGSYDVAIKVKSLDEPQTVFKEVVTRVKLEPSLTGP